MSVDDFGWPVLHGDGFELRVLRVEDAAAWRAGDDAEQQRWFEAPGPATHAQVVGAIGAWRASWRDDGAVRQWAIWSTPDHTLVGGVEIRDRGDGKANLSYVVFPYARRKGYATRAAALAVQWAFAHLQIDAVVAIVDECNAAPRAVVGKLGFRDEGRADAGEYSETGPMLRYRLRSGASGAA